MVIVLKVSYVSQTAKASNLKELKPDPMVGGIKSSLYIVPTWFLIKVSEGRYKFKKEQTPHTVRKALKHDGPAKNED